MAMQHKGERKREKRIRVRIYAQFWFKLEQVGGDGSE
jgi:hypothetical protein